MIRRLGAMTALAAGVVVLLAPLSMAEDAPLPEGYEAPRSTTKTFTAWEAPLTTVSKFYTKPAEVPKEQLAESLGAKDKSTGTLVTL